MAKQKGGRQSADGSKRETLIKHVKGIVGERLGERVLYEGISRAGPDAKDRDVLDAVDGVLSDVLDRMFSIHDEEKAVGWDRGTKMDVPVPDMVTFEECGHCLRRAVSMMETRLIHAAMATTGGDRDEAAKLLEISKRALIYKLKEYGIDASIPKPRLKKQVPPDKSLSIREATRTIEESWIRRVLDETGGNNTQAARLLEISHRAFIYKKKEYGIDKPE